MSAVLLTRERMVIVSVTEPSLQWLARVDVTTGGWPADVFLYCSQLKKNNGGKADAKELTRL